MASPLTRGCPIDEAGIGQPKTFAAVVYGSPIRPPGFRKTGWRTFTSKLSIMLGTQKKPRRGGASQVMPKEIGTPASSRRPTEMLSQAFSLVYGRACPRLIRSRTSERAMLASVVMPSVVSADVLITAT
jgi:hypothetical protein